MNEAQVKPIDKIIAITGDGEDGLFGLGASGTTYRLAGPDRNLAWVAIAPSPELTNPNQVDDTPVPESISKY
jgi:hypothetical protein